MTFVFFLLNVVRLGGSLEILLVIRSQAINNIITSEMADYVHVRRCQMFESCSILVILLSKSVHVLTRSGRQFGPQFDQHNVQQCVHQLFVERRRLQYVQH